ncbi:carbohydrate ABC transporter substrate-binding protein [Halostella sp. JP-L12]|uniref:ABC transporter substrate-binding protein n=1 Tax=Halostella TaxID=1843185 RepID=UPI000EF771E8|nr:MULTISPECIES: ABC transporter substrate-binding protein [Halostella]NHN48525.1 carbohydrate ABC transporter substrate-binding protein [Halostella sp. JP-L12]
MTEDNGNHDVSRRRILQTTGAAGAVGLVGTAGCLSNITGSGGDGGGDGTLNVLHGWTGGDGATAAEALFSGFEEEHSDVETNIEPIGGGGNENLDTVVSNRLSSNDPPSSFAGWPGRNLEQYDGVLGDVEDVWNDIGDAHVDEAAELCQYNGNYAAVPIGSHRLNCLFYNVSVVEDAGVDPDSLSSVSDLVDALETVSSETDATPMAHAMKAPWTTLQLFAVVLLGQEGYDSYMNFVEGGDAESAVSSALETTREILENYINSDASSIGLTESNGMIMDGSAAFIHQGNWAAGAYKNDDMTYDEDWGFVPFPGTEGMYTFHIDSFIYPTDGEENPTPEVSKTFLRYAGGKQAQIDFNSRKGSIPTRTDVSADEFGPFLTETMEDFANAEELPPTLAHGLAVSPSQMTSLKEVITSEFTGPYNVDAATQGMLDVVQQ